MVANSIKLDLQGFIPSNVDKSFWSKVTARSGTQIGGVNSCTITGFYGVSTISLKTLTTKVIEFVTEVS